MTPMFGGMDKFTLTKMIRASILKRMKEKGLNKYKEYKVINEVPNLLPILVDLLSNKFSTFVQDIEWIAPKPPTFRVVLENDQFFYLSDLERSWVADVEGKKYYLLNLGEEQKASTAIARILRYGKPVAAAGDTEFTNDGATADFGGGGAADFPGGDLGGAEPAEELPPGFGEFETTEPATDTEEA